MKQELIVGVSCKNQSWAALLETEGIPWKQCRSGKKISQREFSAIIVNSKASAKEAKSIREFVSGGGSVLTSAEFMPSIIPEFKARPGFIKFIQPEGILFRNCGKVWLENKGWIIEKAQHGMIGNKKAVLWEKIGKGSIIALPFGIEKAMLDERQGLRGFYSIPRNTSERTGVVSKDNVRVLVSNCLQELHFARSLPFIHKWHFPKKAESVFCFNVDLDEFEPMEHSLKALDIFSKSNFKATWFVNGKGCENSGNFAEKLLEKSQSVQSHGFLHEVLENAQENESNFEKIEEFLQKHGARPKGFCTPSGKWNSGLAKILRKRNYDFAVSFGLGFDGLPFEILLENRKKSGVIGITIHPIGIIKMKQMGFSEKEMIDYFKGIIDRNLKAERPVILYGHTSMELGFYPGLLEKVLKYAGSKKGLLASDCASFAKFSKEKNSASFSAILDNGLLASAARPVDVRIITPERKAGIFTVLKSSRINLKKCNKSLNLECLEDTVEEIARPPLKRVIKNIASQILQKAGLGKALRNSMLNKTKGGN